MVKASTNCNSDLMFSPSKQYDVGTKRNILSDFSSPFTIKEGISLKPSEQMTLQWLSAVERLVPAVDYADISANIFS